jgi:enterochelin esterase-like enzyme
MLRHGSRPAKSRRNTPVSRRTRGLSFEHLEDRALMAAMLANTLDDVRVDLVGVSVNPTPQTGPSASSVLVAQGTDKNDVIVVRPSVAAPGAVDCVINQLSATFTQPLSAIVVHGRKGNDTIVVDSALTLDTFLFGGVGNDTITGGSGNDAIVGGAGKDVLTGGAGRDVLLGGDSADTLYGYRGNADSGTEEENLLFANLFTPDHNLPLLRGLAQQWLSDTPQDARVAAVRQIFGAGTIPDRYNDISYGNGPSDWILTVDAIRDQGWYRQPGVARAWFSPAYRDANGFETYQVRSDFERTVTKIRVLLPTGFDATKSYPVVYALPVLAGEANNYGDGLVTIRNLGLQTTKEAIFVGPTFSDKPWYADNATNPQVWQETYFRSVVVPFIDHRYSTLATAEGRLLLGFSKSGVGAFTMLLRHPDEFGRAFAFDSPLNLSSPNFDQYNQILGTTQNYENYRVTTLLQQRADLLKLSPPRLFMTGYYFSFTFDMESQIHRLLEGLQIPHYYDPGYYRPHNWNSGWVAQAVDQLLA